MKHRWIPALGLQLIESLAAGLIQAFCAGMHPVLWGIALWGLVPLAGLFTACRAVRRGLNNYAAWLAPPIGLYAANMLLWRYAPSAGAALLTAFTAIVGAAAGDVLNRQSAQKPKKR